MLFHPRQEKFSSLDEPSRKIMLKTIAYFEDKGKDQLKKEYHQQKWYGDFIAFLKENKVFSTLLSPKEFSNGRDGKRWDTHRICLMNEILAFYGLPYWYAWQVTILGLGPIWMSSNKQAREKAAQQLDRGDIFAFGLSEKEHGADLYSSEMKIELKSSGQHVANGRKYYIGNGNQARMVSTFAVDQENKEYVFFAADSQHPQYHCIDNLVAWQGYVAEYELNQYPVTDEDILSRGDEAWNAALNTVNIGKFNLGWASIGIATHALYEAINHAAHRNLYGKYVTDFPHARMMLVEAVARLHSMRLFSERARDYFRSASRKDRRYLLYNPLVKMKVTTQGEKVIDLLWDVIAAKGFEKNTYFEMAAKEIRALPKLEGTVHVNMALVVKFMKNYFFNPADYPDVTVRTDGRHDSFLFDQGPARGLSAVQFHDFHTIYNAFTTPNIELFKKLIQAFQVMLVKAPPSKQQSKDIDFLLLLGELFTLVVYGQLILERAKQLDLGNEFLDQIFYFLVRDFSEFSLKLYCKPSSDENQMSLYRKMITKPIFCEQTYHHFWEQQVRTLVDSYAMSP
ncbi:MAG: acyl-CoA dehydrogenase [Acidobacteria bacterium]|nr:MAG: acyl-CoA dehydrogenase [Acidobacteriota bacterium]